MIKKIILALVAVLVSASIAMAADAPQVPHRAPLKNTAKKVKDVAKKVAHFAVRHGRHQHQCPMWKHHRHHGKCPAMRGHRHGKRFAKHHRGHRHGPGRRHHKVRMC